MRKAVALLVSLALLTASCVIMVKPAFSSTEVTENTWVQKASMNKARAGLGVAVVDGKIYAIGGLVGNGVATGVNEVYNPETDTWSSRKPMPTPIIYFATAVYQGKIYCIGGTGGVNEVYDPATDTWENKTAMPTARDYITANVVNGKIYVIGGFAFDDSGTGSGSSLSVNEAYDPETDSWTTKTPMPTAAFGHISTVVDNKIYVIDSNLNQIYDIKTDTWSLGASPPLDVGYGGAGGTVGVNAPKRIYVLTEKVWGESRFNQIYDPANDSWMFGVAVPTSRLDFNVAVVNDKLYAIGGFKLSYAELYSIDVVVKPYATNEVYTPFGYGTVPPAVSVVSPENMTYETSNVSLAFTVNKQASWMGYSVDGGETVTIGGNATLEGLANGMHNVTVYATDTFGNEGASETVNFTLEVPEPFPTTLVAAASVATVAIIGVGLLVYFKKSRHSKMTDKTE